MEKYILSEIYTLVPRELYTPETGKSALMEQFGLQGEYIFHNASYQKADAIIAYALPSAAEGSIDECCNTYPFVVRLLKELDNITGYNKVIFHYNAEKGLSHIIIGTGEELKMANSFSSDSFESALYFLFLSIRQLQMNPKQCIVRVCSGIDADQEKTISRFFSGVETNNLDNLIQV